MKIDNQAQNNVKTKEELCKEFFHSLIELGYPVTKDMPRFYFKGYKDAESSLAQTTAIATPNLAIIEKLESRVKELEGALKEIEKVAGFRVGSSQIANRTYIIAHNAINKTS